MKKIKKMIDTMKDEIHSARCYAEKYLEYKSSNSTSIANKYKEMSQDELKHALYIHDFTVAIIDELRKTYTPPVEMEEKWEKSHTKFVEEVAWIKQMLTM